MKGSTIVGLSALGVVLLIALGLLASRVGGIAIRDAATLTDEVGLRASQPIVPGVATVIHWTAPRGVPNSPVSLTIRSAGGEQVVGQAQLGDERAEILVPCDLGSDDVSLLLSLFDDRSNQQLMTWQPVAVLPAGPDCFR